MKIELTPIDTWFFRDSTPFDQGAAAQDGVASGFPPHPPTVVGAVRAALARRHGWGGSKEWSPALMAALGDGAAMGPLRMTGPLVLRGQEPVFPLPRHVLAVVTSGPDKPRRFRASGWMAPGPVVVCDLGRVRLPVIVTAAGDEIAEDLQSDDGQSPVGKPARGPRPWVTLAGLRRILVGAAPAPDELIDPDQLWVAEPRVGIERALASRTVARGMLYSTRHIRLRNGVGLGMEVAGLPAGWGLLAAADGAGAPAMIPLGGESRLAAVTSWAGLALDGEVGAAARRTGRLTLIALTPLRLPAGAIRAGALLAPGLRLVSACVDRALRIGGWDSLAPGPLPLTNAVAPGATLFCQAEALDASVFDLNRGLVRIGYDTAAGFGLCAVARDPWKELP